MNRTSRLEISTIDEARRSKKAALSISEVGRILELDPRTVSASASAGEIPSVRVGRRVLIPREAFLAIFDAQLVDAR